MALLSALGGLRLTDPSSGVGGPRQATVLAVLLANRGRPVRVEQLIDEVWGPSPPPAVRKALRGYISRLRRLLHSAATIESQSGAYRLDAAIDAFDVDRFTDLADQARATTGPTAAGHLAEALRLIGSAEPYDGIDAPSVNRERVRLNELRVSCLVRRAELMLESGELATVLPELQQAALDNPLVEKLAVLLMSALYQAGRQAEALEVYRDLRHRLVEELGLEPSPEARQLELRILRQTVPPSMPSPSLSTPMVRAVTPFVGRSTELKTLERAWQQIRADSRAVSRRAAVMVSGDAGIGKSTLCAEFGRLVSEDGATVLYGRCDEGFAGPYQALVEPVRALVHRLAPSALAAMPGVRELSRLVPLPPSVAGERLPARADAAAERWMLFEAVAELLALAGHEGPLVLVLDDLHWAEQSTLLLIRHLLRTARPLRLLLIGTYREAEPDRSEPLLDLLADMHRDDQTVRLTIGGFDETDTLRLIEVSTPGAAFDPGLPGKLMTATGGNPFFTREMLRHLIDGGRLDGAAIRAFTGDGRGLPVSIQEILSRRTARLPEPARRVLALVATVGGEISFTLLEAMANSDGVESGALIDSLDVAVERRLLSETGDATYAFPHALVRQAVLDELTGARRRHLHRRALEGLIAIRSTDLEALARHSLDAVPLIPIASAVDHAIAAARQLSERAAHETAAARLEQVLAVVEAHAPPSDVELRCNLLLELAVLHRLLRRSHDARYALRAADDARQLGSLEYLIRAAESYPQSTTTMEDDERRLVGEVVARSAAAPALLRSRALILQADLEARWGRREVALEAADEALSLAQASGNGATVLEAVAVKGFALLGTERMQEILDLRRLAQAETAAGHTPRGVPSLIVRRALVDLAAGDRAGFDRNRLEVELEWEQTRAADIGAAALNTRIVHARLEGRWDDALLAADRYLEENPDDPDAQQIWAAHQVGIHREIGRTADLVSLVESMIEADPGLGHFRLGLAAPYLDSGRFDEAAQIVCELARPGLPDLPRDATFLLRLTVLAEAVAVVGDPTELGIVWSALLPYSGMISSPDASYVLHGTVDRYLGMLAIRRASPEEAEQWFARALETEEKLKAPPLEARTRFWLGRLLLSREAPGDRDRGRRHLDRSLQIASELGMSVLAAEIRAVGAVGRAA